MKSYEYRAFAVAAPDLLNSLPDNTRSCDNLSIFLGKLIIVSMAIFISVLIQLLFYYLFNCFGMLTISLSSCTIFEAYLINSLQFSVS